jgi:hypothetical protein
MSGEESGGNSNIKDTIEAATGLVKAIPIYDDLVQPVAKQLGKSLELVGRAVNVALIPVKGLVWGFEEVEKLFIPKLVESLKDVPPEDIVQPKPNVAGPAIEALRYVGHEESLRDMYANLLASAMDKATALNAHPAFVEIIKQFTPDEAKLMAFLLEPRLFPILTVRAKRQGGGTKDVGVNISLLGTEARLKDPELCPAYLDNLCRLGLAEIPSGITYNDNEVYEELINSVGVMNLKQHVEATNHICDFKFSIVRTTPFGKQFGAACVTPR